MPAFIPLQLATRVAEPPEGSEWIHEIKFDGYRAEARLDGGKVKILTRSGLDWTGRFPIIAKAVAELPATRALIDGEIIALGRGNAPSFALLQQALSEGRDDGLIYMVFDLLHLDGRDVSKLPLRERKELLEELVRTVDAAYPLQRSFRRRCAEDLPPRLPHGARRRGVEDWLMILTVPAAAGAG